MITVSATGFFLPIIQTKSHGTRRIWMIVFSLATVMSLRGTSLLVHGWEKASGGSVEQLRILAVRHMGKGQQDRVLLLSLNSKAL